MRVPLTIDDAWRALVALPPVRGELAGYAGTAVLEEADDDLHVAVFRLQGSARTAAVTATVTTALAPAPDGTSVAFELDLRPGPGAELTREAVLAALEAAVPAILAASPPAPVVSPPAEPVRRSPTKALVAAGAAAALAAWALRRRG